MLTLIIYQAQHSDTALVLDRTRKPFQCNALLADLGKYFQNLNFNFLNFFNFLATMLTVFTAKYTSKHASGGTLTLLMQACISLF
jgi:hypothetical protein